jgi:hypothetical protein
MNFFQSAAQLGCLLDHFESFTQNSGHTARRPSQAFHKNYGFGHSQRQEKRV